MAETWILILTFKFGIGLHPVNPITYNTVISPVVYPSYVACSDSMKDQKVPNLFAFTCVKQ